MADGGDRLEPRLEWTDAEDAKLRAAYSTGGMQAARAALPHRSDGAIYCRTTRLKIRAPAKGRVKLEWPHRDDIDAAIRSAHQRNAPVGEYARIARRFERPQWYVSRRATTLGCRLSKEGPGRPWSEDEDALLEATSAAAAASAAVTFKRNGFTRTARAIAARRYQLSIIRTDGGEVTCHGLAALLGITHGPIRRWIESGRLKARRDDLSGDRRYLIRERDLRAFIVENPCAFSLRTLPPGSQPWLVGVLAG